MRPVYRALLCLYPYDYRQRFEAEMVATFRSERPLAELSGLLAGALREWIAKWTTPAFLRGRHLPDVRMMRPVGVTKQDWFGQPPLH
jgi:hypothetical protein